MSKVAISVKVDKDIKESAQEVAKNMGLNLSSLVNSYLHQVVATRRVELFAPVQMTPHLEKQLEKVEKNIKEGNISPAYDNADDFIAALKAE
jgi:addiction module RelB/DinJ family antitoxin